MKDVALQRFPVAHDKDIPSQERFDLFRKFTLLGGVDDTGRLKPEGKVVIKKVTSYLRDLRLHKYAEHFIDFTRHAKTSTKTELVKILKNVLGKFRRSQAIS